MTMEPVVIEYEAWHLKNFGNKMNWCDIPDYMKEGVARYILHGIAPGHFLSAIFQNDFMEALSRADDNNMRCLKNYGFLLYNHVPNGCYGSKEVFKSWLDQGGLNT